MEQPVPPIFAVLDMDIADRVRRIAEEVARVDLVTMMRMTMVVRGTIVIIAVVRGMMRMMHVVNLVRVVPTPSAMDTMNAMQMPILAQQY